MRILIITPHYIEQPSGGTFASRANIGAFASLFQDCTLIYPDKGNNISKYFPSNVQLIPCPDKRTKIQKGIDVYRGILTRFAKFATSYIKNNKFDIIVFDHSITTIGIIDTAIKYSNYIITIHHNIEANYYRDNKPPIYLRYAMIPRIEKAERVALFKSNLNLTLTEEDKRYFIENMNANPNNIYCLSTSESYIDKPRFVKEKTIDYNNIRFIITGSLCFPQSTNSIKNFINNYFPIIKNEIPNSQLIIAGRNPSKELSHLINNKNKISLIPNPIDIFQLIDESDIYICPTELGSGIKLRIMDGLKCGLPIIAHAHSCRGYEKLVEKGIIRSYHNLETFKQALKSIKEHPISPDKILKEYYTLFSLQAETERLKYALTKYLNINSYDY